VYASLRKAFKERIVPLGSRFSGRGVVDALIVSRILVREALERLESDGAVQGMAKSATAASDEGN
jgi:DNA-binding GntR family transcriptional regulator